MEGSPLRKLGQIGVVVKDMDKAIALLSSLGVGPFEAPKGSPFVKRECYGKPAAYKLKSMIAKLGDIELELLQPIEGKGVHQEFLETKGEGLHHLGFFVENVEKEKAKLVKQGFTVTLNGTRANGGGYAYFDTDKVGGIIVELIQR